MKERAALVRGLPDVESIPGEGNRVCLELGIGNMKKNLVVIVSAAMLLALPLNLLAEKKSCMF